MEHEFRIMLPTGTSLHASRIGLRKVVINELLAMEKEVKNEASKLADANVDIIGFGCTTGSLVAGHKYDERIVEHIERTTGKPAVATASAVVEALKFLGLSRISIVTPYTEDLNKLERTFLERSNFVISRMAGLGLTDNLKIAEVTPKIISNLVRKVDTSRTEGIFISCTNLPTINMIAKLEKALRKPVVSSNTATLWAMLKRIKHTFHTEKYGKLFLLC